MTARLVISLDFELHWGVRDVRSVAEYRENLLGEHVAVEALLKLFMMRGIHATWATVGALFCESREELIKALPAALPTYDDNKLSPYEYLEREVGVDAKSDPFHFAPTLVRAIDGTAGQELATHTFGHYYCLEPGQTPEQFDADLSAAQRVAARVGCRMTSLVFPRNQYNPAYRPIIRRHGIHAIRSNGEHWAYVAQAGHEPAARRAYRLVDAYARLSGARTHRLFRGADGLVDVPASAFLRPYDPRLRGLERRRVSRVIDGMTTAARRGECFHLWWHPHNFGRNLRENLVVLEELFDEFERLRARYGMQSMSMREAAAEL